MGTITPNVVLFLKKSWPRLLVRLAFFALAFGFAVVAVNEFQIYINVLSSPDTILDRLHFNLTQGQLSALLLISVAGWSALAAYCFFPVKGWWVCWQFTWLFFTAQALGGVSGLLFEPYAYLVCDDLWWPVGCNPWLGAAALLWDLLALGIMYLKPPLRKRVLWVFSVCWLLYVIVMYWVI